MSAQRWRMDFGDSVLDVATVVCPYCGERIQLLVDRSAGEQSYVEDCSVCCAPIEVAVALGADDFSVRVARDDE